MNARARKSGGRSLISALVLLALCGCSSFNREWKKAATLSNEGLAGRWQGRWESEQTHHSGKLRCIITPRSNDVYAARFHANFAGLFTFGYTATLKTKPGDYPFNFSGSADLGKFAGGIYRYEGHASSTNYFSTYESKSDHGSFNMNRGAR